MALQSEGRLPLSQVIAVLAAQFCEAFQVNILFPFVVFMVRDFHITEREADVGQLAGLLAATFSAAQFISGFFWGALSDRWGRKRVILIGLVGVLLANIVFGTAKTFTQAILGRFLCGLLNGNVGVLKSFLAEITIPSNRARAFSLLPLAWGAGCIIGPVVGGVLARPAVQYPGLPWGPFAVFPYLLPCFVGIILQGVTAILVAFLMVEPRTRTPSKSKHGRSDSVVPLKSAKTDDGAVDLLSTTERADMEMEDFPGEAANEDSLEPSKPSELFSGTLAVLMRRKPVTTTAAYSTLALFSISFDEGLPILLATPVVLGGLGLQSSTIGGLLMGGGAALLGAQLVIPQILARFGLLTVYRMAWVAVIPLPIIIPYLYPLQDSHPFLPIGIIAGLLTIRGAALGAAFTTSFLMTSNACSRTHVGAVNGMAQSAGCFARAIGPAATGAIWSASIAPDAGAFFFLRHATLFFMLAGLGGLGLLLSLLIPDDIQCSVEDSPDPPCLDALT